MRSRFDGAAYRIAFTYSAVYALATIALGAFVYLSAHAAFERQLDSRIEAESKELLANAHPNDFADLRAVIATRERANPKTRLGYALFDRHGNRIAGDLNTPRPLPGWQHINFLDPLDGLDRARGLAVDLPDGTRLLVAADSDALEQIDLTILILFILAFCVIAVLGVAGAFILGGFLHGKIGRISMTAEAIISGDLNQRMPVGPRGDEFDHCLAR